VETVTDSGEIAAVYNLRIAEYHTYFIGSREWGFSVWAHNANGFCGGVGAQTSGSVHHIATNKNWVSTLQGGPWSPIFDKIFKKAGMTLEDAANKVSIPGHYGPHPEAYHQAIFEKLSNATDGLSGQAYKDALLKELAVISQQVQTVGSKLNKLLTGK
jgi:hypothetical protein